MAKRKEIKIAGEPSEFVDADDGGVTDAPSAPAEQPKKHVEDPVKRAHLRRMAHAASKSKEEAAKWPTNGRYEVTNVWGESVAVTYRHENPSRGYITETLPKDGKLTITGAQLSDHIKGLALPRNSRKKEPVVTIKLLGLFTETGEAIVLPPPAEEELSEEAVRALEEGAALPELPELSNQ